MAKNSEDQQEDPVEEQSDDQADEETPGVDEGADDSEEEEGDDSEDGEEGGDDADADGDGEVNLLTDDEFEALKNDPAKLRKELNRAATKKFQALAKTRQTLKPYAEFIKAFEKDSVAATVALARQLNIDVKLPKSATSENAEEIAEDIGKRINKKVKAALGPEYEDLADKMSVAIQAAAEEIVEDRVKPLKEGQETLITDAAAQEASRTIKVFSKKYPDWQKHEKAMTRLSKQLLPGDGMSTGEYLESLYLIATKDGKMGDKLKKTINKMTRSVGDSEGRTRSVSDKTVSNNPGRNLTFREAAAMAERGEKLDD